MVDAEVVSRDSREQLPFYGRSESRRMLLGVKTVGLDGFPNGSPKRVDGWQTCRIIESQLRDVSSACKGHKLY